MIWMSRCPFAEPVGLHQSAGRALRIPASKNAPQALTDSEEEAVVLLPSLVK